MIVGIGFDWKVVEFEVNYDDYNVILLKLLVDCLVEVMVECMYEWVCKEYWGYVVDEVFSNVELIKEKYSGICFVLGYFVCLDYIEKVMLFRILDVEKVMGVCIIEYFVMFLIVVVSGWYFFYLDFKYYVVGKINKD